MHGPLDTAAELLDRLAAERARATGLTETLALLETLARCAFATAPGGSTYATSGLAALGELPGIQVKSLLARLQRQRPPASELIDATRELDFSDRAEGDFLSGPMRAALGLWLGRNAESLAPRQDEALWTSACDAFITRTHPRSLAQLARATGELPVEVRDGAFAAWCARRPLPADPEDTDAEIEAFEALSAGPRLVSAVALMMRTPCARDVAESWIPLCEPGWSAPRDNAGRALADARLAAVVGVAGDMASAEGLLWHAQSGLDRENDPQRRAEIYGALFASTAILATAPLGGPGAGAWLAQVDKLIRDRVTMRQRDAWFAARRAAIDTLPRAALAGHAVAERGHETLRDLGRRIPERWLDLLHLATMTAQWRSGGRDPEVHLSAIADILGREGLPSVDPRIDLATITSLIALAAPSRLVPLGERLTSPAARGLWWSTALSSALPLPVSHA